MKYQCIKSFVSAKGKQFHFNMSYSDYEYGKLSEAEKKNFSEIRTNDLYDSNDSHTPFVPDTNIGSFETPSIPDSSPDFGGGDFGGGGAGGDF